MHTVAAFHRLDFSLSTHDDLAATRHIGVSYALAPHNRSASWKVGPLHYLHQVFDRCVWAINQLNDRITDLSGIVRWYVGGHAHGDAGCTVDQQVGQSGRQYGWLSQGGIEILGEVHRVLLDVDQHLLGYCGETGLGVAHGRGRVIVHATEVALPVHQRLPHAEVLRHSYHGVVDRAVAVRVILSEYLAYQSRTLLVGSVGTHAQTVHGVQYSPLHRLKAVPNVW